jgi:glutamate N-acetyltransferase/amino-acid N-acetyltransferase
MLANGQAGPVDAAEFTRALGDACLRMTEVLARDGEGATKLLRVRVRGAASSGEARRIARSVVDSPLVKTMARGADPNVGRLLMAVGKCFECTVDPAATHASINGTPVVRGGLRLNFDEDALRRSLAGDPVDLDIELNVGAGVATAYGCDLSEGYVTENAAYFSS